MRSVRFAVFYGFLIWLIVFAVAMLIFPIRQNNRPLFESIMPVALTACVVAFACLYLRRLSGGYLREAILLGAVWFIVNIALDLLMFSWGPMAMSLTDYVADIGLTYLLIPMIPVGMGWLLQQHAAGG